MCTEQQGKVAYPSSRESQSSTLSILSTWSCRSRVSELSIVPGFSHTPANARLAIGTRCSLCTLHTWEKNRETCYRFVSDWSLSMLRTGAPAGPAAPSGPWGPLSPLAPGRPGWPTGPLFPRSPYVCSGAREEENDVFIVCETCRVRMGLQFHTP